MIEIADNGRNLTSWTTALLVLSCIVLALPGVTEAKKPAWKFTVEAGEYRASEIEIKNNCRAPHVFQVEAGGMPFLTLSTSEALEVTPAVARSIEVRFDSAGLKPKTYKGKIHIRCLDCKTEPGCRQRKDTVQVEMKVIQGKARPQGAAVAAPPPAAPTPTAPALASPGATDSLNEPAQVVGMPEELAPYRDWWTPVCPAGTQLTDRSFTWRGRTITFYCCYHPAKTFTQPYTCPQGGSPGNLNGQACCRQSGPGEVPSCWDCRHVACPSGYSVKGTVCAKGLPARCLPPELRPPIDIDFNADDLFFERQLID